MAEDLQDRLTRAAIDCADCRAHAAGRLAETLPGIEVEGELQGDAAPSRQVIERPFPGSRLTEAANLLVMPTWTPSRCIS
jgi:phosphotransacetylase